jgi:hypothetical protein
MPFADRLFFTVLGALIFFGIANAVSNAVFRQEWVQQKLSQKCFIESYAGKRPTPVWKCPNDNTAYLEP